MKIVSVTVSAEASAKFQKGCVSYTISPDDGKTLLDPADIENIENIAVQQAVKVLNNIIPNIPPDQIQVKSQATPASQKQLPPSAYIKQAQPVGGYASNDGYCTPKQANWLIKFLHMDPNAAKVMHYSEANQIIKDYCAKHGYEARKMPRNKPYDPNQFNGQESYKAQDPQPAQDDNAGYVNANDQPPYEYPTQYADPNQDQGA